MGCIDSQHVALMALRRLLVEDFELIARAELEPAGTLTAITGETGSGKTMLLDAIDFVLGARTNADAVRKGSRRARVSVEFDVNERVRDTLAGQGLDGEDDTLVVVRELADGKTSARVGGVPVSAGQLRALGRELVEIVGQHEAQRLLAPAQQLEAVDRFGGDKVLGLAELVAQAYRQHAAAVAALAELDASSGRAAADADYAAFASREIADADPNPGEDEALRARRDVLANGARITDALRAAHDALSGERSAGAADLLGAAATALGAVARYDPELQQLRDTAAALQSESVELAASIARRLETAEGDPGELESITERLALLDRLKKKYGTTLEDVRDAKARFDAILENAHNAEGHRSKLELARERAAKELHDAAAALSAARKRAARACEKKIAEELAALAMPAAKFEIALEPVDAAGPRGAERCEFLFSANPGEPLRPLARSASGGELSRVMLALIVVLADRSSGATLVFDEIDAGVGGATANAVGARLADLASDLQVVCVTHLAQIAAYAEEQVALRKRESKDATTIDIVPLDRERRLEELARMLSGATTGVSLEHAKVLLRERTSRR